MQTEDGGTAPTVDRRVYERGKRMGKFAIFYHTDISGEDPLLGTKVDAERLRKEISQLGFEAQIHPNMKCEDLFAELKKYAKDDHSDSTCFGLAIFTHGGEKDVMYASDRVEYNLSQVLEKFTTENCESLKGKPKFFLLNTCRGGEKRPKAFTGTAEEPKTKLLTIPKEADFLVAHSTCPDDKAWVSPGMGSFYVTSFCEAIANDDFDDIQEIFTWVNDKTVEACANKYDAKYLQMPTFSSQLTAQLLLREPCGVARQNKSFYNMLQPERGFFYIFSDERDADVQQLENVAQDLNFKAQHFLRKKNTDMQDIATKYIAANYEDHDCFVCVIKTYSKSHDELYDGLQMPYKLKHFVQRFHGNECVALKGKPKIFIIQAPYLMVPAGSNERGTEHIIPDSADTLIVYSTSPAEHKSGSGGTLFIHTLCEHLKELRTTGHDLLSVLSLVIQRMSEQVGLHVPTVTSQLRKRVAFK